MLNNSDYDSILEFVYELEKNHCDFPQHVLQLLNRYFKFEHTTFFPLYNNNSSYSLDEAAGKDGKIDKVSNNFVALNLDRNRLKLYSEYYYKTDIFQPINLPKPLVKKPVLSITDIMPYSKYQSTEYHNFLSYNGFYYQTSMFLNVDNIHLGSIGILRSKNEGDFSKNDYMILETIHKFIAHNYKIAVDMAKTSFRQNLLKNCVEKTPVGILVLDSKFTLVECNKSAYEFCLEIFDTKESIDNSNYLNIIVTSNSSNIYIQQAINFIKNNFLNYNSNQNFNIFANTNVFCFTVTSFLLSDALGNIETIYSVSITKQAAQSNEIVDEVGKKYDLTKRELEVVALIKMGCSNKEIADKMFISNHTVKAHIMKIFSKVGVTSRTALIFKFGGETN